MNPPFQLMIFMNQSHMKKNMNKMLSYYSLLFIYILTIINSAIYAFPFKFSKINYSNLRKETHTLNTKHRKAQKMRGLTRLHSLQEVKIRHTIISAGQ